jgi:hypothetical protein
LLRKESGRVISHRELGKLHNEELHNLYSSPSIMRMVRSRGMRWAEHVAGIWERINTYRLMVGNPERERPQGRSRCRWVDNNGMALRVIG